MLLNIYKCLITSIVYLLALQGCGPSATEIAHKTGFKQQYIATDKFHLHSLQKIQAPLAAVNIYIEGDGHVLANRRIIAKDPTPHSKLVVQMATIDPSPNVIYLARPCQGSSQDLNTVCDNKYWTHARYSEEVIHAINTAIDRLTQQYKFSKINLIGYSGGAAIAVLVAARRDDITSIRTVAGNLDLTTMQNIHKTTSLYESLDPITVATHVNKIPQMHFVGSKDYTVPQQVAQQYCKMAGLDRAHIKILAGVGHEKGWLKAWPQLLALNYPAHVK